MIGLKKPMYKGKDYTGETLGSLKVIKWKRYKPYGTAGKKYQEWEVKCNCGNTFSTNMCHVIKKPSGCSKCYSKKTRGSNSTHWKGGKYVTGYFVSKVKQRLERPSKTIEYSLSIDFLDSLYEKQNKKCALSGLPVGFETVATKTKEQCSISLDRIDSSKGYTEDNVQFVHKIINVMKQDLSQIDFIELCVDVADYQRREDIVI